MLDGPGNQNSVSSQIVVLNKHCRQEKVPYLEICINFNTDKMHEWMLSHFNVSSSLRYYGDTAPPIVQGNHYSMKLSPWEMVPYWGLRISFCCWKASICNIKITYEKKWIFLIVPNTLFLKYFLILAALGLSCGTQNLRSSLWYTGSLVAAWELHVVCGIYFPDQRSNLGPLHWQHRVLTTEPPGRSLLLLLLLLNLFSRARLCATP